MYVRMHCSILQSFQSDILDSEHHGQNAQAHHENKNLQHVKFATTATMLSNVRDEGMPVILLATNSCPRDGSISGPSLIFAASICHPINHPMQTLERRAHLV